MNKKNTHAHTQPLWEYKPVQGLKYDKKKYEIIFLKDGTANVSGNGNSECVSYLAFPLLSGIYRIFYIECCYIGQCCSARCNK